MVGEFDNLPCKAPILRTVFLGALDAFAILGAFGMIRVDGYRVRAGQGPQPATSKPIFLGLDPQLIPGGAE